MSTHAERIAEIVADLTQVHRECGDLLKAADDGAATRAPGGAGWTAAQTGYHVGLTNARMAQTVGKPGKDAPPDFVENRDVFKGIPPKVRASEAVEPPSEVNKGAAIETLDEGFAALIDAFRRLPEDRGGQIVTFPFGSLSMYQFGEFAVGHARRHLEQMRRALGGGAAL